MTGRGLVHPVDIMANEAWSESLLDFLAVDLVENGYDLKRTLRVIATCDACLQEPGCRAASPYSRSASRPRPPRSAVAHNRAVYGL